MAAKKKVKNSSNVTRTTPRKTSNQQSKLLPMIIAVVILFLALFFYKKVQAPATTPAPAVTSTTYSGLFPCADCPGIETVLTLTTHTANSGTYVMSETYQERNDGKPFITKGTWSLTTGTKSDPKATVYELSTPTKGVVNYFRKVDATHIRQLTNDKEEIPSSLNFTLTEEK